MKPRGVFLVGLNGSGKTTLGRALAEALGWFRMDVEDYYFPDMAVPYANPRPEDEVRRMMLADIRAHGDFVLSSVRADLGGDIRKHCSLAVWLRAPAEIRMARIERRELARFGDRVLPGGDMYERQRQFREMVANRTEACVEESLRALACPVLALDATLPIEASLSAVLDRCRALGLFDG